MKETQPIQSTLDFDGVGINSISDNPKEVIDAYMKKMPNLKDTKIFKQSHNFDFQQIGLILNEGILSKRRLNAIFELSFQNNSTSKLQHLLKDTFEELEMSEYDRKRIFHEATEYLRFLRRVRNVIAQETKQNIANVLQKN